MSNAFTKRNHYNPCFWTACWNKYYFQALLNGTSDSLTPREQDIYVLNLQSGKIFNNRVKNVHFDKNLGIAEITPESMKDFCLRHYPLQYKEFCKALEKQPESVFLDFEDILTFMEKADGYQSLMEAVTFNGIKNVIHKGFLTCHIVLQAMRSHEMMNSMINTMGLLGLPKWEYFWTLKNAWGNPFVLARATKPLAFSRWILYRTEEHTFPLCDSPVMIRENTLMMVLSPRLLLEIKLNEQSTEDSWTIRKGINSSKYWEFRRRSILNSFKEIIFHDPKELENWRNTQEFKLRSNDLCDSTKTAQIIAEAARRVIWAINGFGRIPPDFELKLKEEINNH
jgi:hypothetical protein